MTGESRRKKERDMTEEAVKQKRERKPGIRRVTVTLREEDYKALLGAAEKEMREPNNLLSFLLRDQMSQLLQPYGG
jgi:hypothetical protein